MNWKSIAASLVLFLAIVSPAGAVKPEGIVYEAEAISSPDSAWVKDRRLSDRWMLWTTEPDIQSKRSGGAVLAGPVVTKDRSSPEEGAPPLHSVVKDLKPGVYQVYVSAPGRPLAYSLDGKKWFRHAGGELNLGLRRITSQFELWVDDRYAPPPGGSPGGGYYDYIRFVPVPEEQAKALLESQIRFVETWSPEPGIVEVCWTTTQPVPAGIVEYGIGENHKRTELNETTGQNHRVRLTNLDPAAQYNARIVIENLGQTLTSQPFTFRAAPPTPAATQKQIIPLTIAEPTGQARSNWPATVGMPFAKGMLADVRDLRLTDSTGQSIPLQAELLSRWPDGSVQWCVLSFLANTREQDQTSQYQLEASPNRTATSSSELLTVVPSKDAETLRAGDLRVKVSQSEGLFQVGNALPAKLQLTTADGQVLTVGRVDGNGITIESNGPVRAVAYCSGPLLTADGKPSWRYLARMTFWKGQPTIGLDISVLNDQSTPRFVAVRSLELHVPLKDKALRGAFDGAALQPISGDQSLWLLQDKQQHFQQSIGGKLTEGKQSAGIAQLADDHTRLTAILPEFWQTYPKGHVIGADGLRVQLLPPLKPDTYSDPESLKVFHRLYAWFDKGNYLIRTAQLTRSQVFLHYDKPTSAVDGQRLAAWIGAPLLPQASPSYLCGTGVLGRKLFPAKPGVWDDYEGLFTHLFAQSVRDREVCGTYGWMHYGDWFGERVLNYGNNEYDMAWTLAVQWMRTGRREYFDRGQQMARHYSSVDTLHGESTNAQNGIVWQHSYNHLGTDRPIEQLHLDVLGKKSDNYLDLYGGRMFQGAIDRQGHVFQEGNWIYAALTGDRFLWDVANRVCTNQAEKLTNNFDFGIERAGGWPLINTVAAYRHTANPYYLNAARLMIERCLQRQDPATGGWLHRPPLNETDNETVLGGKAFAVGMLSNGILRYLEQEPQSRPEVQRMLVRGADWLMNESWIPGKGFRYISNCEKYRNTGGRGGTSLLNCELVAFAYGQTKDPKYRDFWTDMMGDELTRRFKDGIGKSFAQQLRQTIFGLDRAQELGLKTAAPSGK